MKEIFDKTRRAAEKVGPLISYIGCICVAFLIMYYLNGAIGIFIASVLMCALVLSLILTLAAVKTVTAEIKTDTDLIAKGENVICSVRFSNALWLPVPMAEIRVETSPHFLHDDVRVYKCVLAGKGTNTLKIPLKAVHSGLASIKTTNAAISDFLGIFTFKLNIDDKEFTAAIYPDIPEVPVQTDFLKTANRFTSTDEEEEESNETSPIPTGMPGYDHREYIPGDPIKRINWKLSSKRDIYMVRLDEQIHGTGQMFFLDAPDDIPETDHTLHVRDIVAEGALSMLSMLVREGRDAVFYICRTNEWIPCEIHEQGDVLVLQELLAHFSPCKAPTLIPAEITDSGKTPICLTTAIKGSSSSVSAIISQYPEALVISAYCSGIALASAGHWTISDEYEFVKSSEI
ncbi:MAG: DUF58 domain-containing protein [Firmicutes bacterium]|nr:DUF58 domain-containing protein [Bacillota bacterium]